MQISAVGPASGRYNGAGAGDGVIHHRTLRLVRLLFCERLAGAARRSVETLEKAHPLAHAAADLRRLTPGIKSPPPLPSPACATVTLCKHVHIHVQTPAHSHRHCRFPACRFHFPQWFHLLLRKRFTWPCDELASCQRWNPIFAPRQLG